MHVEHDLVQPFLRTCRRHTEVTWPVLVGLRQPARLARKRIAMEELDGAIANRGVCDARCLAARGFSERIFAQHDIEPEGKFVRACAFEQGGAVRTRACDVHTGDAATEVTP